MIARVVRENDTNVTCTDYHIIMNRTVEGFIIPESHSRQPLALLARLGNLEAMALWRCSGNDWQCLASIGNAALLPEPDGLAESDPEPRVGRLFLTEGATRIGALLWIGEVPGWFEEVAPLWIGDRFAAPLYPEPAVTSGVIDVLREMGRACDEMTSLNHYLPRVHQLLGRLMESGNLALALCDETDSSVYYPYYTDSRDPDPPRPDALFPLRTARRSLTAWLIRHGKAEVLGRDALLRLVREQDLEPPGLLPGCWMGVPLVNVSGKVIGAAVLQRYEDLPPFDAREQAVFQFVARQTGFALDRWIYRERIEKRLWLKTGELEGLQARLLAEVAERKRVERFQKVLYSIAELSNTSLSLEAFLAGLHRLLQELVAAPNCLVTLYDPVSDVLTFPYCADERAIATRARKPGKGPVERVLHGGRPLMLRKGDDTLDPDVTSWLGVPLYCGSELLGVLSIHSYSASAGLGWRDQEVLEFIANNIGTALARVKALEDLQRACGDLEERVLERTHALDAVNARLQFDSLHDPLTKLPNRTYFSKTLRRTWEAYASSAGERFAVLFIDLDRFKLVNDTLGHLAGDHLLFEAGARIRNCLRHYDFLSRLGGDEFAVLLFGVTDVASCELVARHIVSAFECPVILSGREVFTTASVGLVIADKEYYHKSEDLLRDADHAMYCTKQQGRHGYTVFNHELRVNQADQLALESELRRALDETGQLIPYYQPFVDADSGQLLGFETLVRWQHPSRGLLAPAVFLPIAEESGLIMRLDRYMIQAACHQLSQWRDEGRVDESISLHINLSSGNFHDSELLPWIAELIETCRLPSHMVHLEITESALIDVPETAQRVMHALHDMGIRLDLDDFGTGYSALSYLHRFRFDVLKIDQSFVRELPDKEESIAIIRAILAMAAALGLEVVAEGVETAEQRQMLREMGCRCLQGYYFARPVSASAVDWTRLPRGPSMQDVPLRNPPAIPI